MTKLKKITSIEKLPIDALEALQKKYPEGWEGKTIKISTGNGAFFHAVSLEFKDVSYLVKVPVEIDSFHYWDKEEDLSEIEAQVDKKKIEKELQEEEDSDNYND